MSTQLTIRTITGQLITGVSYTVNGSALPSDPTALAAGMPGGMGMGVYHLHTASGWVYVPASQIAGVTQIQSGAG